MIVSASRRTDIPALYPEWFVNRLLAEEVLVPDPYNRKRVSRVSLAREMIDCFVFWTKNPEPMLPYLRMIDLLGYPYYFEMTVTDYGKDLEPNLPSMEDRIASFILLSERLGKERVDLRFDPILLNDRYTIDYHVEHFELLCEWLHNYTERCIISFIDDYRGSRFLELEMEDMLEIGEKLGKIAQKYQLPLYTCAEKVDLGMFGIRHASCIDRQKIEGLTGYRLDVAKDKGQRRECGCVQSVDIGMYDTCIHGCRYCYATGQGESAARKHKRHDPQSPMLIGNIQGDEVITDRHMALLKDDQMSIFDFL